MLVITVMSWKEWEWERRCETGLCNIRRWRQSWHSIRQIAVFISGVARICCEEGQSWKLGHGTLTANFRAGCSSCWVTNSHVTNAILIERAVRCYLHQLISQTAQYLHSWMSELLQSELTRSSATAKSTARPSRLVGVLYDIYRETNNRSTANQPLVRNWPWNLPNYAK